MIPRRHIRYGWRRDLPDHRDLLFAAPHADIQNAPDHADLRGPYMPPVYDQGMLSSCTGNATAAALQYERRVQGCDPDYVPSRLFLYWNARAYESDTALDGGAQIRDAIKGAATYGAPPEETWPYEADCVLMHPTDDAYVAGKLDLAVEYQRLKSLGMIRYAIGVMQKPVVFGFSVYDAMESDEVARTGVVPMPGPNDDPVGGHAVLAVGYNDANEVLLVRNSWGEAWGQGGYFMLPYDYITETLATDFWMIGKVSDG